MVFQTFSYGSDQYQVADLYRPDGTPRAVVCLLHGGFWRMPYGRDDLQPVCELLQADGYAVWNMEYRRVGGSGGWPNTFLDVAAGIEFLAELKSRGIDLSLDKVVVAGHSAGGHLALWSAGRERFPGVPPSNITLRAVAGLAPVANLLVGHALGVGRNAVLDFMGATPDAAPARFETASPASMLPMGVRQSVIHGTEDEALPVSMSRDYAAAVTASGDQISYLELNGAGHMDFLDPASAAISAFRDWLKLV